MRRFMIPIILLLFIFLMVYLFFTNKTNIPKIETVGTSVIDIKDQDQFKKMALNQVPAVVKFETTWCGACKTIAPMYQAFADKYKDKINFLVVEMDKLTELADEYNIKGAPTFIFFKDGKEVNRIVGVVNETTFEDKLNLILSK